VTRNSTARRLRRELEESLRRLRTDYIDLYQVHWPDPLVPIEETAMVMGDFLKTGRIRAIGVSNYSRSQTVAFRRVAPLHAVQPPYNLFEREIEDEVLPYAKQKRLSVLAYGALCRGLLSGKVSASRRYHGDDLRNIDPKFREPRLGGYLAAVRALERLARERYGRSVIALAVRWLLDQGAAVALWGARHPGQLAPAGEAMGWSLDDAALREIDRIIAVNVADPIGPAFMAPPARALDGDLRYAMT
jgi:aryl-alcohol dehydrogenase-like predicted oxidoreductase